MTAINVFNKLYYNVQAIISDLEDSQGEERQKQDVVIRKLMRRKSKRETAAIWSEIRNGVLRRTNSVEDLSQEGDQRKTDLPTTVERRAKTRVRHHSDGNYDDVSLVKTDAQDNVRVLRTKTSVEDNVRAVKTTTGVEDNVYENVSFFQGSAQFGQRVQSEVQRGNNPPLETRYKPGELV